MAKLFYYQIKNIIRTKELIWWTALFPIVLGTLFYVTFGTVDTDERFEKIPVAVVYEKDNPAFEMVLEQVDDDLLKVQNKSMKQAEDALRKKDVKVILVVSDTISMKTLEATVESGIVQVFLDEYVSYESAVKTIGKEHPEQLDKVIASISKDARQENAVKEDSVSTKDYNPYMGYFYALIAMVCLFSGFLSQGAISELQADQSALGARKNVAPISKGKLIVMDVVTSWLISFLIILFTLFYLLIVLRLQFGTDLRYMLILAVVGSYFGISLGIFTTVFVKGSFEKKNAVLLTISLTFCFFGGLMIVQIVNLIEKSVPILNRINPAALMVQAFRSVSIYGTDTIFMQNMGKLFIAALLMNVLSILVLRRKNYAAI